MPGAVQDVDALVRVAWVDEDLLVLLEPSVHGIPFKADQIAQLFDRRLRVVPGGVLDLAVAALDSKLVGVAPARRTLGVSARSQQLHAHVLPREVIRGVIGDLPHELEALCVGDEFSAEVGTHSFSSAIDVNTLSGLRHRMLPYSSVQFPFAFRYDCRSPMVQDRPGQGPRGKRDRGDSFRTPADRTAGRRRSLPIA